MKTYNRHAKGVKIAGKSRGGQFKGGTREAGDAPVAEIAYKFREKSLDLHPEIRELAEKISQDHERSMELLRKEGYAEATSSESLTRPDSTKHIQDWWGQKFMQAQKNADDKGGFLLMPDDYTPKKTSGKALSGKRRTHRMRYTGSGADVRMPSVTAIRRFGKENGNQTFDVPIEGRYGGKTVSGFVRVTPGPHGTYEVTAPGMEHPHDLAMSETVTALLESRRPSYALREVEGAYQNYLSKHKGDKNPAISPLHYHRMKRGHEGGVRTVAPLSSSSFITGVGYSKSDGVVVVEIGNRVYGYPASQDTALEILGAPSPGKAFNRELRGLKPRINVVLCSNCDRYYVADKRHRCFHPATHKFSKERDKFRDKIRDIPLRPLKKQQA